MGNIVFFYTSSHKYHLCSAQISILSGRSSYS